jgi:hypothetical protein
MMRARSLWLGMSLAASALAAPGHERDDETVPELDLLEYLGSWQGADEEWLTIVDWQHGKGPAVKPKGKRNSTDDD